MDTITGNWEGALIPEAGGTLTVFALQQPERAPSLTAGTTLRLGGGVLRPVLLLEGASRAMVALAEGIRDPDSGALAQLLLQARLAGDSLVGHWMRRDAAGRVLAQGWLTADRM